MMDCYFCEVQIRRTGTAASRKLLELNKEMKALENTCRLVLMDERGEAGSNNRRQCAKRYTHAFAYQDGLCLRRICIYRFRYICTYQGTVSLSITTQAVTHFGRASLKTIDA